MINNKQEEALRKLSRLKVGALFMEMGTGKTKVALDLIKSKAHKIDYILWICPFSLKQEIKAECEKWQPDLKIEIVGCETIGASDNTYMRLLTKVAKCKTFMVVDESLKIKNIKAKRTNRIIKMGEYAAYKLILNGTPISKNCLDLYPQMQFLSPKILKMSYRQFKDTFTEYYVRGRLKGLVKKQHNIPYLVSLIEPYIFDSELDISAAKNYYDYEYAMDFYTQAEYCNLKNELINSFAHNESKIDVMKLFTLLQKCYTNTSEKNTIVDTIVNDFYDEQFIVFVKFIKNINGPCIQGSTPMQAREQIIEDFRNNKIRVLYLTYGVGSFGLNLQNCKNIIFADQTFDYAQKIQAEARIYRIGQKEDVNYYNLWCKIGLENLIHKSLDKKVNLLSQVKKEIERVGFEQWARKNI